MGRMPTPIRWQVPMELSPDEARLAATLHRIGKFYVFLRTVRAELFDEAFQAELAAVYQPRGTAPLPAALLAMVTVLQAYDQVGDAEAVVAARVDQRWQLVLGCLGASEAPFSQGALVKFRERMIAHDLDQKLLDRTVALAKQTGRFGWQAAARRAGLVPAGGRRPRGRYLESARARVGGGGDVRGRDPQDLARPGAAGAGVTLLGAPSLKAALGYRLERSRGQADALARLLAEVDRVEAWVAAHVPVAETPPVQAALDALRRVLTQDLEPDPTTGQRRIRRGVAAERMPSLGDPEMRHGRKTRTTPLHRLQTPRHQTGGRRSDRRRRRAAANEPEHHALALLEPDVVQHGPLAELQIDRGYLGSVRDSPRSHAQGVAIRAKAWTSTNRGRFPKPAFTIELVRGARGLSRPAGASRFPSAPRSEAVRRSAAPPDGRPPLTVARTGVGKRRSLASARTDRLHSFRPNCTARNCRWPVVASASARGVRGFRLQPEGSAKELKCSHPCQDVRRTGVPMPSRS